MAQVFKPTVCLADVATAEKSRRRKPRTYNSALQARYAQREGMDTSDPEEVSFIPPLDKDKLQLVINVTTQAAEAECRGASWRAWLTGSVAMTAAIISAIAAIASAILHHS